MNKVPCPRCGAECDPGEPRCPSCGGYMGVRRRAIRTPDSEPADEERFGVPRPIWWFLNMFPGLFSARVLILAIVAMLIACVLIWLSLLIFLLGAMFAAMMIGAAGIICYWTAVAWLLYGELAAPSAILADFNSTKWLVFSLLAMLPIIVTAIYVKGSP